MLSSKFHQLFASKHFQSIALLRKSFHKPRTRTSSNSRCNNKYDKNINHRNSKYKYHHNQSIIKNNHQLDNLSYTNNNIDISKRYFKQQSNNIKQSSKQPKHTQNQIKQKIINKIYSSTSTSKINSQIINHSNISHNQHDSINIKINLLKSPVYSKKKNKKLLSNIHSIKLVKNVNRPNNSYNNHNKTPKSSDKLKKAFKQHHQNSLLNNQEDKTHQKQQQISNNINNTINTQNTKHFRHLTSIPSHKNIQFQINSKTQKVKVHNRQYSYNKSSVSDKKNFFGISQSKNLILRQQMTDHPSWSRKTISDLKSSQHILKRSSLFLVNFLKQKQKVQQKNQGENQPHIGNIANTTEKMKIIITKPNKKETKSYGKVKHKTSKSSSNIFGTGNSIVISPW